MDLFHLINMHWDQWLILLTGPTAVLFTQIKIKSLHRWACILGLIGQIGWFWSTYHAEQWGAFFSCFAYTYVWCIGVKNYWLTRS